MKKLLIPSLAIVAFAIMAMKPYSAHDAALQTDQPIDIYVHNTCCNEDVHITGNEHIVITGHNQEHFNINVSGLVGIGSNNDVYHGNMSFHTDTRLNDGSYSVTEHFEMSSSTGCKFELTQSEHITYDKNGNIQSDRGDYTVTCL